MNYTLVYTSQSKKDAKRLSSAGLAEKAKKLLQIIVVNPWKNPPPYEKLVGELDGAISRRINIQHRLVYEVIEKQKIIKIIRMYSHYE